MKKYLKWAFVLTMILAMVAIGAVACDDDETEEPTAPVTGEPTAPATEEPEKEAYKIGAVLSISGPASSLGIPEDNTAKMMEDQINAAGGINGHPIKMVIYDDETSPEKCATLTTRLVVTVSVVSSNPSGSARSTE